MLHLKIRQRLTKHISNVYIFDRMMLSDLMFSRMQGMCIHTSRPEDVDVFITIVTGFVEGRHHLAVDM